MPPLDSVPSFAAAELRRFFTAVDDHLTSSATITVIGGSAIALYGVAAGTVDIDTWQTNVAALQEAIVRARAATGLNIPVVPAAVADVPWNSQDRLQREAEAWTRLTVLKLEPHDLALSKAVRGNEHDLAGIKALHGVTPLDLETLITRYLTEMGHAVGDRRRLDENIVAMIERLHGEVEAERLEERLRLHRRQRSPR